MSAFAINTRVFFGLDGHENLHAFLATRDVGRRIAPIVDSALRDNRAVAKVLDGFRAHNYEVAEPVFWTADHEPYYDEVDDFAGPFRESAPDLILALGGGTVIDMAKGVAVLCTNAGRAIDYRGMHKVREPSVPLVACPSTAGTGTEATWTASFIDREEGRKLGINGNHVAPLCGLLEPELVASCPPPVVASSGLDAMVHAIEAVSARTATEITVALGARAFAMVYADLPGCLVGDASEAAWGRLQLGAYLAGVAMMNAGGGPASGISYPLGVHYGVPHGFAGGVFLADVFAFNVAAGYLGYAPVYDQLSDARPALDPAEKSRDFVRLFRAFYERIGGPRDLQRWNCAGPQAVERLTALTVAERRENLELNPVPFGVAAVEELLAKVCA